MKIDQEANERNLKLIRQLNERHEKENKFKDLNPYETMVRNNTIEEVAQHIEKLKGFGQDTVSSLAIYIREMKK